MERDYYCSQKFEWLQIRLYDGYVSSCCAAESDKLELSLLEKDPESYFNWPNLVQEREMMKMNQRVSSCENSCWSLEDRGLPSRRTETPVHKIYPNTRSLQPRTVNILINNTCNMTCSYCNKNFSNSWARDLVNHGNYELEGFETRYMMTDLDKITYKLSQKDLDKSRFSGLILKRLQDNKSSIKKLLLTGGEPFLYNQLLEVIENFKDKPIYITTGLGVNNARFSKILSQLPECDINFRISGENTGLYHEFNRYGCSHQQWLDNLKLVEGRWPFVIHSILSNLTLFDFLPFYKANQGREIEIDFVLDPNFMSPHVIDPASKNRLIDEIRQFNDPALEKIIPVIEKEPTEQARQNTWKFLQRFTKTRNLSLDIFPREFLEWVSADS